MLSPYGQNRFLIPTMIIIALLAAAAGFFVSVKQAQLEQAQAAQRQIPGLFWPNPRQVAEFNTLDHSNQGFGLSQLQGKWSLVFFGYTNCPDICPITMSVLAQTYPALTERLPDVQVNSFTRQLGAAYFLNKEEGVNNYLVDHSASLFVIDPQARMVGKLSPPHDPELIKQQFFRIQEFIDAQG